ncbi:MAG: STAS domain-containing protein [Anaerolineales bacterium]|nr:STAS domain-containing protein [Anaerolineales bacterium]
MNINIREFKRVSIISVEGRIDSNTAAEFEEAVENTLTNTGSNLIFDLSKVDFLSSSGLRVMVTARKNSQSKGGEFSLCCLSTQARESLSIAGLDVLFQIYPDRETAIGSY